jgi:hypothetical protein
MQRSFWPVLMLCATAVADVHDVAAASSSLAFAANFLPAQQTVRCPSQALKMQSCAPAPLASHTRRAACQLLLGAGLSLSVPGHCQALEWIPKPPEEGDCADCIGLICLVFLSVCLSVCLSACLSVCLPVSVCHGARAVLREFCNRSSLKRCSSSFMIAL